MNDEKVVVVLQSADPVELEMARSLLEEAEIPCAVVGGSAAGALTAILGSSVPGLSELRVPASFEERAHDVLEKAWGDPDEEG